MTSFNAADWVVIGTYLAGIIWIGIVAGRGQRTARDYFLGSRDVPWWGIGLSIVAAETSALTIISVPAMAFGGDLSFLQMVIGYAVGRVILAVVMVPHYLKGEIYSPYELLGRAFGQPAKQMVAGLFLVSETLAAGVRVYVASIPIRLMLGDRLLGFGTGDPILGAILLFVVLSLVYTYFGGVKAVIWTDAIQFGLFMAGGLYTVTFLTTGAGLGAGADLWGKAWAAGKLHVFNTGFSLSMPFNLWMGLIGGVFVVMSTHGAEQLIVQRVLACGTVRDGRRALLLSTVLILPLFLVFLCVGALLWAYYQAVPMAVSIPEVRPGSGIKANDYVYPIFMMTAVPHVMRGFLIVAILAAAMSSVSSALTSLASVSTMDFLKPLFRGTTAESALFAASRRSTVVWATLLIGVAYLSREVEYVLNTAFALRGLTSGALLGSLFLVLWWRTGRALPVIVGSMASVGCVLWMSLHRWIVLGPDGRVHQASVAWPWYTLVGTVITLVVAGLVRGAMGPTREAGTGR